MSYGPRFKASAPSNIALVKYWGKLAGHQQVAANSSLSMTLSSCEAVTTCRVATEHSGDHIVTFSGERVTRDHKDGRKIFAHLDRMAALADTDSPRPFEVDTYNTFPTSAGIASSAAGLAALTIAAAAALKNTACWQELAEQGFGRPVLADLARLGSGSAGRSVLGGYVKWHSGEPTAGAPRQKIESLWSADHWPLCDTIAVLSGNEKAVSSTDAHREVWTSPLFDLRLATLPHTLRVIETAIAERDIAALGEAIEQEAVNMHAVSMTAKRPITFPSDRSFALMAAIKRWRQKDGLKVYFTLDAGENVHIIHEPDQLAGLLERLRGFAGVIDTLCDKIGEGPRLEAL